MGRMHRPLTLLDGFDAVRAFLEARFRNDGGRSGDLAILLGGMSRELAADARPADPAQWSDWLDAVASVRPGLGETAGAVATRQIDPLDGFHAMRAFLDAYWGRGDRQERDIGAVLRSLTGPDGQPDAVQRDRWFAAIRTVQAGGQS
jgi:hypothetical protein